MSEIGLIDFQTTELLTTISYFITGLAVVVAIVLTIWEFSK